MGDVGDSFDIAGERSQIATDAKVAAIRAKEEIEPGRRGACDFCGEHSGRLIDGACAPCRDRYKLWNR